MRMFIRIAMLPILAIGIYLLFIDKNDEIPLEPAQSFAIVQLFTSQGCSSCPSADRLLEKIKSEYKEKNVFVMSYHVDYWNRLGWTDPFSKKEFTQKQYAYANEFGEGRVYTPQAIVNGKEHFVGSKESIMKSKIKEFLGQPQPNKVTIFNTSLTGKEINLKYTVAGDLGERVITLALVIDNRKTDVQRGENNGRTISNSNIVVNESSIPLATRNGEAALSIPELVQDSDQLRLIVYVQDKELKICGATSVELQ